MNPSMAFGSVYPNEVPVSFMHSWTNFLMFDLVHGGMLLNGPGLISVRYGTDGISAARNNVVEQFLKSQAEWLFWADSDMGFSPDSVYKLLAVGHPQDRPIVGGLCFASRETSCDGMGGYRTVPSPTVFQLTDVDGRMIPTGGHEYPVSSVVKVAATGSAFIVVHRSVYERLGSGWYDRMPNHDGSLMGEDVSFCVRAGDAGMPTHVYTGARTSHFKPQWVQESDFWRSLVVEPATEPVDVVVPVMRRPLNAGPFMRSLRASTGLATVWAVADRNDDETIDAWTREDAEVVVVDSPGTFARKVNAGYRATSFSPWLFLTGDDVRFHPGWLDHAQHVAAKWNAHVVGTNDLHSPRCADGTHSPHLLIRRSYVGERGASWDGPGVVAHEGYKHWYVDDEIVTVAKQRQVWQMALGSAVEHLHPLWGAAADDEVYRLGQSHADADRAVYERRLAEHRSAP